MNRYRPLIRRTVRRAIVASPPRVPDVLARAPLRELRRRRGNEPAALREQPRCEDGPGLIAADGIEDQFETPVPFRVHARDALERGPIVGNDVIRAARADEFLVPAAAHADDEPGPQPALGDLDCEVSDPARSSDHEDAGI